MRRRAFKSNRHVVSRELVSREGATICAGDVALVRINGGITVAEIWFHARIGTLLLTCVSPWEATGEEDNSYAMSYRVRERPGLLHSDDVVVSLIYIRKADRVDVLVPVLWRT